MAKYCKIYLKEDVGFWDTKWSLFDEYPIPDDMDDATIKAKAMAEVNKLRGLRIGRVKYRIVERKK